MKKSVKSMKKKTKNAKKDVKENKMYELEKDFIAFGNRKHVFWKITIATIILSIIGIPIMIRYEDFFIRFLVIWILEIIYIGMYVKSKKERKKKQ